MLQRPKTLLLTSRVICRSYSFSQQLMNHKDLLSKMSNKFCCLDQIPTLLLKDCVKELNQLNVHLSRHSLYSEVQSGYRPNHSCETLLVRMCDDINREIGAGNVVIVVLLDLSAAFDTIDHTVLLEKLLNDYGVTGSALQWMKSYLEKRYFCVKIDDMLSSFLELLFGVPQGSLLGQSIFILYIKAPQKIAGEYGLDIQLYADDSQLYISFHPNRASQ